MGRNDKIVLPKDNDRLAHMMLMHADRTDAVMMLRRTAWMLAFYYLNGFRNFHIYNPSTGQVMAKSLENDGTASFHSSDLLSKINQVAGRIQGMNLRPRVEREGHQLASLRNQSRAQIIGDAITSRNQIDLAQEQYAFTLASLGFCGLTGHVTDHPTLGLTNDVEAIHPRELTPFPSMGHDTTSVGGIMRRRSVTLDRLEEIYGKRRISALEDRMDWYEVDHGEPHDQHRDLDALPGARTTAGRSSITGHTYKAGGGLRVASVQELWVLGPHHTSTEYVLSCGDAIIDRRDLSQLEVYCPVSWSRFFNNGSFWGAGMFDILFSMHREMEKLLVSVFQNIRNIDRYGILILPQGEMNQDVILKDVGNGLRAAFWQPDAFNESFDPFNIQPFNTGDVPGRTASFAKQLLDDLNPLKDLIDEKGRVDSASGLAFLDERITEALTSPTKGIQVAWGHMYRAAVQRATNILVRSPRPIPVTHMTLDLAGAQIDPDSGNVDFSRTPLPSISRLYFTVQDISPRSAVARKTEALELFQRVDPDPRKLRLLALQEGLDFAIYMDGDRRAYEQIVRDILTLYGDGDTPGQIVLTPHLVKADLFLTILTDFMAGPEMRAASPEVIDEFQRVKEFLIMSMGLVLPAAVPNPDDAAMLSQLPQGTPQAALPQGAGAPA